MPLAKRLSNVTGTQQLKREDWLWCDGSGIEGALATANDKSIPRADAVKPLADLVLRGCAERGIELSAAYFVIHDAGGDEGARHVHWLLRSGKHAVSEWARAIGVEEQYVSMLAGGRKYCLSNTLAYLVHFKDVDKVQYEPGDVYTAVGRSYLEEYEDRREEWENGRAIKTVARSNEKAERYKLAILRGDMTIRDVIEQDLVMYNENKVAFRDARASYLELAAIQYQRAIGAGEFKKVCLFFSGPAGAGKSTAAQRLAELISDWSETVYGRRWGYYRTASGSNPFDDWDGEEILILDDNDSYNLSPSTWRKLCDSDFASSVGARYFNRNLTTRVVIATSAQGLKEFFFYMQKRDFIDPVDQYWRRFAAEVRVSKVSGSDDRRLLLIPRHEYEDRRSVPVGGVRRDGDSSGRSALSRFDFDEHEGSYYSFDDGIRVLVGMVARANGAEYEGCVGLSGEPFEDGHPLDDKGEKPMSVPTGRREYVLIDEDVLLWYQMRCLLSEPEPEPEPVEGNPFAGLEPFDEVSRRMFPKDGFEVGMRKSLSASAETRYLVLENRILEEIRRANPGRLEGVSLHALDDIGMIAYLSGESVYGSLVNDWLFDTNNDEIA